MAEDFIKQIRAANPFPWRYVTFSNGVVRVVDAANNEVPMFQMLECVCFLSNVINKQKEAA